MQMDLVQFIKYQRNVREKAETSISKKSIGNVEKQLRQELIFFDEIRYEYIATVCVCVTKLTVHTPMLF